MDKTSNGSNRINSSQQTSVPVETQKKETKKTESGHTWTNLKTGQKIAVVMTGIFTSVLGPGIGIALAFGLAHILSKYNKNSSNLNPRTESHMENVGNKNLVKSQKTIEKDDKFTNTKLLESKVKNQFTTKEPEKEKPSESFMNSIKDINSKLEAKTYLMTKIGGETFNEMTIKDYKALAKTDSKKFTDIINYMAQTNPKMAAKLLFQTNPKTLIKDISKNLNEMLLPKDLKGLIESMKEIEKEESQKNKNTDILPINISSKLTQASTKEVNLNKEKSGPQDIEIKFKGKTFNAKNPKEIADYITDTKKEELSINKKDENGNKVENYNILHQLAEAGVSKENLDKIRDECEGNMKAKFYYLYNSKAYIGKEKLAVEDYLNKK